MINRIKAFVVLMFGVIGLSGCILVDDEVPVYSSYPYGSYEAAMDYYHRPPRQYYISHHKHAKPLPPKEHHLDKPHHRPQPPVKDKLHTPKKPDHHDLKPGHNALKPGHNDLKPGHHDFKKDIKQPAPVQPKQPIKEKRFDPKNPGHHDFKKDIKKPEQPKKPIEERLHQPNKSAPHDFKKDMNQSKPISHKIKHK